MQAERDVVKELQIKLREANAEKQELQLATEQLRDDVKELRRQLNEAVADKTSKENEIKELMERRIRCSVCMGLREGHRLRLRSCLLQRMRERVAKMHRLLD
ncbi:hypothetical protein AAVH_27812 [Aphelenchoides avenae]|nr:hypothetical protein AAVH_27812 [Aphelenchus avenae]